MLFIEVDNVTFKYEIPASENNFNHNSSLILYYKLIPTDSQLIPIDDQFAIAQPYIYSNDIIITNNIIIIIIIKTGGVLNFGLKIQHDSD